MPHLPLLRVVPLETIRRHEEIDPLRVDRLVARIETEGIQVNPMVGCTAPDGGLVLLDGATRTESLRRLGVEHAVVQLVDPETVTLETWHHVVRGCTTAEFLEAVGARPGLLLAADEGTPCIHLNTGEDHLVLGTGISPNATLSSLVESYVGRWRVSRTHHPDGVGWSFPDWSAVVEFPIHTLDDVMKAAVSNDLLPPGITRFLVHERALRINVPLDLLKTQQSTGAKQMVVDEMIAERARDGRVRRYEETVFILDD
ncbi:MAG: hypothetical protein ACRDU9_00610 [Acidimicrobiia bacterium]